MLVNSNEQERSSPVGFTNLVNLSLSALSSKYVDGKSPPGKDDETKTVSAFAGKENVDIANPHKNEKIEERDLLFF
ncbi:MAG: hypothetical protein F6K11_00870 [Leptolyngbya sp. SIO3F4]|nr:hypothetical protein [Leptolyngbya sp. SIO3F4]